MVAGTRAWAIVVSLAVSLVFWATGAGQAQADAPPSPFFGTISFQFSGQADLERMAASGVQTLRVPIYWQSIQPARGAPFDFKAYDALFASVARANLAPQPWIYSSPSWIGPKPARAPILTSADRAAWSAFLSALATRYGNGGSFWRENPGIPNRPVAYWQIWNEPNIKAFWGARPNPRQYASLLRISRAALTLGDGGAKVVTAGIFRRPDPRYGISMDTFLRGLYRVPRVRSSFDALALHPYSAKPNRVFQTTRDARRIMRHHHDPDPLWITELGWATGGLELNRSPFRATEEQQAGFLTRSYQLLLQHRVGLGLQRLFWHTWSDYEGPGGEFWTTHMGLLHVDGSPKPAYWAFVREAAP